MCVHKYKVSKIDFSRSYRKGIFSAEQLYDIQNNCVLVHLKPVHAIVCHHLDAMCANSNRMDLLCWMIAAHILKSYASGPVTRFYLLTQDFDGRSPWLQGCRATQGIRSQTLQRLIVNKCAQIVRYSPLRLKQPMKCVLWLWLGDLGQILERQALREALNSVHVVVDPFDMLVRMWDTVAVINGICDERMHQFWGRINVQIPSDMLQLPNLVVTLGLRVLSG